MAMANLIHDLSIARAMIIILMMTGHLVQSHACNIKQKKWASLFNEAVRDFVLDRFKDYPDAGEELPSIDELQELLENARRGDRNALARCGQLSRNPATFISSSSDSSFYYHWSVYIPDSLAILQATVCLRGSHKRTLTV